MREWSDGYVEWSDGNIVYISVVFSWKLKKAQERINYFKSKNNYVIVGGPAVLYDQTYLSNVDEINLFMEDIIAKHNPNATFTTRGCIRKCKFCIVNKIEKEFLELNDWPIRPIICDNNLLVSSSKHFNSVIDKLKPLKGIDFNQGLDARLLTKEMASRLAELDLYCVRLAWDHIKLEKDFLRAVDLFVSVGIPKKKIRTYILIGYNDTPEDALYRLQTTKDLGMWPNPMRYQPLDVEKRNGYVDPNWTDRQLKNYMRYWSCLRYLEHIKFEDYDYQFMTKKRQQCL